MHVLLDLTIEAQPELAAPLRARVREATRSRYSTGAVDDAVLVADEFFSVAAANGVGSARFRLQGTSRVVDLTLTIHQAGALAPTGIGSSRSRILDGICAGWRVHENARGTVLWASLVDTQRGIERRRRRL